MSQEVKIWEEIDFIWGAISKAEERLKEIEDHFKKIEDHLEAFESTSILILESLKTKMNKIEETQLKTLRKIEMLDRLSMN